MGRSLATRVLGGEFSSRLRLVLLSLTSSSLPPPVLDLPVVPGISVPGSHSEHRQPGEPLLLHLGLVVVGGEDGRVVVDVLDEDRDGEVGGGAVPPVARQPEPSQYNSYAKNDEL